MRLPVVTLLGLTLLAAPVQSKSRQRESPRQPLVVLPHTLAYLEKQDDAARKKEVDDAIKRALAFLKNNQQPDGHWSRGNAKNPAITSLCVMAFLSAGHVPGEGRYGETIEKGIRAVLKMQQTNGLIANNGQHEMYHHGISTLMLAEVIGMTQGQLAEDIRKALEKAVRIILIAQRSGQSETDAHRGGWRYRVAGTDTDISVTGWQIMALRAAKNVGCDIPPERIDRAVAYVKRCQDGSNGGFRYEPHRQVTVPCTGTSILCLSLCASKKDQYKQEIERGGAYLLKHRPHWGGGFFFYGVYYCSQATFQLGGTYWDFYRPQLHKILLQAQKPTGYWEDPDSYGPHYATAMAVLALTVEYRFLPIYQRDEGVQKRK